MRALFIFVGVAVISKFHWIIYVFGAFLIWSGIKMAMKKDEEIHPEKNPVLRIFNRFMPIAKDYTGSKFFIKKEGKRFATPLLVVLLVIESSDVVFAIDSVPAILAITLDTFIVYTSNVMAILGLRALYFALSGMMQKFTYLHYGLTAILVFIGVKMLLMDLFKIPTSAALGMVAGVLFISIMASVIFPKKK